MLATVLEVSCWILSPIVAYFVGFARGFHKYNRNMLGTKPKCVCGHWQGSHDSNEAGYRNGKCTAAATDKYGDITSRACACQEYTQDIWSKK